jgi:Domain of unknown function (DUF4082)/PEP-CTERM motif
MRTSRRGLAAALCATALLSLVVASSAAASTLAVNVTNTTGTTLSNPPFTLGWHFTVLNDITLTDLGLFDDSQDGLTDSYEIGLWDSSQTLLRSATLSSGSGTTLIEEFRFVSVSPLLLSAGQTYAIGALYISGNDFLIFPGAATGFTTAPDLTFLNNAFAGDGSLSFPGDSSEPGAAYFGPNFRYDSAAIPEPASLTLFGLGLAGIARRRWRQR